MQWDNEVPALIRASNRSHSPRQPHAWTHMPPDATCIVYSSFILHEACFRRMEDVDKMRRVAEGGPAEEEPWCLQGICRAATNFFSTWQTCSLVFLYPKLMWKSLYSSQKKTCSDSFFVLSGHRMTFIVEGIPLRNTYHPSPLVQTF